MLLLALLGILYDMIGELIMQVYATFPTYNKQSSPKPYNLVLAIPATGSSRQSDQSCSIDSLRSVH